MRGLKDLSRYLTEKVVVYHASFVLPSPRSLGWILQHGDIELERTEPQTTVAEP